MCLEKLLSTNTTKAPNTLKTMEFREIHKNKREIEVKNSEVYSEKTFKGDSNTRCQTESQSKVNRCLEEGVISYEYLRSDKIYDPKHPPIIDKGVTYFYQDDQALYRKIKKYVQIFF